MASKPGDLSSDLASAYVALLAEREAMQAELEWLSPVLPNWQAEGANSQAMLSDNEVRIAHLELPTERLKRELYGQRSERTARLIEQLECNSKTSRPQRLRRRRPRACVPSRASVKLGEDVPVPNGARVWLATGHTDVRRASRAWLLVQETLSVMRTMVICSSPAAAAACRSRSFDIKLTYLRRYLFPLRDRRHMV